MFCSECGENLPDNARFCLQCGRPMSEDTTTPMSETAKPSVFCTKCGEKLNVSAKFCLKCGAKVVVAELSSQGTSTTSKCPHGSVKRKFSYTGKKKGFCQTCGAVITSSDAHCPKCGAVNAVRQATTSKMNDLITQTMVEADLSSNRLLAIFFVVGLLTLIIAWGFGLHEAVIYSVKRLFNL